MAASTDEILLFFLSLISPDGFEKFTDTQIAYKFWEIAKKDARGAIKEARKLIQDYKGYTFEQALKILFMLDEPVTEEFKERSKMYGTLHLMQDQTIYRFDKIYLTLYTSMKLDACSTACDYSCLNPNHRETLVMTSDEARKREERSWQQVQDIIADHEEHKEERLAAWRAKQKRKEKEEKARKAAEKKAKTMENRINRFKQETSPDTKPSRSISRGKIENVIPDVKPIKSVQSRRQKKLPSASPLPNLMGTFAMTPHVSPPISSQQSQPGSSHQPVPNQSWFNQAGHFAPPPHVQQQVQLALQGSHQLQQNPLLGFPSMLTPAMEELLKMFSPGA